jgi:hypothetical protein
MTLALPLSIGESLLYKRKCMFLRGHKFWSAHWARTWALFQQKKDQPHLLNACGALETLTIKIFVRMNDSLVID